MIQPSRSRTGGASTLLAGGGENRSSSSFESLRRQRHWVSQELAAKNNLRTVGPSLTPTTADDSTLAASLAVGGAISTGGVSVGVGYWSDGFGGAVAVTDGCAPVNYASSCLYTTDYFCDSSFFLYFGIGCSPCAAPCFPKSCWYGGLNYYYCGWKPWSAPWYCGYLSFTDCWYPCSFPCYAPPLCKPSYWWPTTTVVYQSTPQYVYLPGSTETTYVADNSVQPLPSIDAGWELLAGGNDAAALETFYRILSANPNDRTPNVGYALANAFVGAHDSAVVAMRLAIGDRAENILVVPDIPALRERLHVLAADLGARAKEPGRGGLDSLFMLASIRAILYENSDAYFATDLAIDRGDDSVSARNLKSMLESRLYSGLGSAGGSGLDSGTR